ncbi:MAG TPA: hypothetical protein VKZ98_04890 [Aquaticitalea sp.]|nr:hypothetical protein [Aquaticitalea sp.]
MMKRKRIFKVKSDMPDQLKTERQNHLELYEALKAKNNDKLKNFGIDLKAIKDGLRVLKNKG